jgi:phosphohistidine phosphatase
MRRLILIRHAKAVPATGQDDFSRELTDRGRDDAKRIALLLAERSLTPDALIASSAERTRETAEIFAAHWPKRVDVSEELGLYDATLYMLFERVRMFADAQPHIALVGHNPGVGDLAVYLAGKGKRRDLERMAGKYPTCAAAVLDFSVSHWQDVAPRSAELALYATPGEL